MLNYLKETLSFLDAIQKDPISPRAQVLWHYLLYFNNQAAIALDNDDTLTLEDTLEDTAVNVAEQALRHTERDRIKALVFGRDSPLSEREQQVVYQHYWQSKPVRKIDCERRWGKDTAKSYLDRAIRKFKRSLIIE